MRHAWAKLAVEHKLYSMRDVNDAERRARADTFASIRALLVLFRDKHREDAADIPIYDALDAAIRQLDLTKLDEEKQR